jgi:hypothetical protein
VLISQTPKWIPHLANGLFDRALIVISPAGSGEPVTCPVRIGALPQSVEQLNTIKVSASSRNVVGNTSHSFAEFKVFKEDDSD